MTNLDSEYDFQSEKSFVVKDNIKWHQISDEELVQLLAQCVIYNSDDIIAFNKPVS